jgi:hypothetical protein
LANGRCAGRGTAEDAPNLDGGGPSRGSTGDRLARGSLALQGRDGSAHNRGHCANRWSGHPPASQNARQDRCTPHQVGQQALQRASISWRQHGDDRRSDHRFGLSLVLLVRSGLRHDLGQRLMVGNLVMRDLVCDFL